MSLSSSVFGSRTATTVLTVTGVLTLSSGVAGLVWWFYRRLNRATRMDALKDNFCNIEQLYSTIETLRRDIEELKAAKPVLKSISYESDAEIPSKRSKSVRFKKTASILSSTDTEYHSAWSGAEDSSEEFFDFSDNDDEAEDFPSLDNSATHREEALQIFERVDSLLEASSDNHQLAYDLLMTYEKEFSANVEFLWRITKCCRMTAQSCKDEKLKKEISFKAVEYAERAVAADEFSAEAHKWYAIALGSIGDFVGVAEKIRNGFTFKEHIDKAMKINPSDALLHHLLGRFCYEVSMLSWIERKVAATIYSNLPAGSVEEALSHFENAEGLRSKPWKENRLYLARCFVQLGKYSDAIFWVDRAIQIPAETAEDQVAQDELATLQRKYSGYRR